MNKRTIKTSNLAGKRVFIRCDFNVPLNEKGEIREDTRIRRALPTIKMALEKGAKVILASHLGRPKGQRVPGLSLKPVARRLAELLKKPVGLSSDCIGPETEEMVGNLHGGDILLLENLRFHLGETENIPAFAESLGKLADVVVNDAFGTAHRAHASNVGIAQFVPETVAGLLMADEISFFNRAVREPERPLVAILGGSKVSTKIGVIEALLDKVDKIIIGGGMAGTFCRAQGHNTGKSLVEEGMISIAKTALEKAAEKNVEMLLPVDTVAADRLAEDATSQVLPVNQMASDLMSLDIGPETIKSFGSALEGVKTIVWNGPMGVFEMAPFAKGTVAIAEVVAGSDALSIIGGGDTDAAVKQAGVADKLSYISTGGGAFMELLEGKELPGIMALSDA